jgi:hypothetical protein
MRRLSFLLFVCLLFGAGSAEAEAPTDPDSQTAPQTDSSTRAIEIVTAEPEQASASTLKLNAELLDELLLRSTEQTIREQKFAGAAGITGGMVLLGLASWRLIEDDPQSAYSRGLGVMFMAFGMANLTTGIYAVTRIPHETRRLERWKKARKDGITEVELAHFEGELQASREVREGERLFLRWGGLTNALAGVLVLAFAPIPDSSSRTDRVSGYIAGSVFVFIGMATFAASFRPTPSEKAWTEYNKRKIPMAGHEFSWRLAPSVSRRGAGLSFGATF